MPMTLEQAKARRDELTYSLHHEDDAEFLRLDRAIQKAEQAEARAEQAKRFSKEAVKANLGREIADLERNFGFSNLTGEAHLKNCADRAKFAYGRYIAYTELLEAISDGDI